MLSHCTGTSDQRCHQLHAEEAGEVGETDERANLQERRRARLWDAIIARTVHGILRHVHVAADVPAVANPGGKVNENRAVCASCRSSGPCVLLETLL
ncbi:hypothetical protein KL904_004052 [Ogataea polymorpha]|nr:hypothetical protein KL904_004052 [Ogataea polymorpha]